MSTKKGPSDKIRRVLSVDRDQAALIILVVAILSAGLRIGLEVTEGHEETPYEPVPQTEFRRVEAPAMVPRQRPTPTVAPALAGEPAASAEPTPTPTPPPPSPRPTPRPTSASVSPYKPNRTFPADVRAARAFALERLGARQFRCLDILWDRESRWRTTAQNKSSGAYGIPQALPGTKMASAGADWKTNPMTQVKWGLRYISGRYGTACRALDHSYRTGWY